MDNERDEGGPAFPNSRQENHRNEVLMWESPGMSLRDYFAARAVPSVHMEYMAMKEGAGLTLEDYQDIAADTYRLADAMLKARSA